MSRKPRAPNAHLKDRCEHGVRHITGRGDVHRHEALRCPAIEKRLVTRGIHTMHRDESGAGTLYPHCGVARISWCTVHGERDDTKTRLREARCPFRVTTTRRVARSAWLPRDFMSRRQVGAHQRSTRKATATQCAGNHSHEAQCRQRQAGRLGHG